MNANHDVLRLRRTGLRAQCLRGASDLRLKVSNDLSDRAKSGPVAVADLGSASIEEPSKLASSRLHLETRRQRPIVATHIDGGTRRKVSEGQINPAIEIDAGGNGPEKSAPARIFPTGSRARFGIS